jgi:hypothetical protein
MSTTTVRLPEELKTRIVLVLAVRGQRERRFQPPG